jgi:hypothetical protein
MQMKVKYDLSASPFHVKEDLVTRLRNSLFSCEFSGAEDHVGDDPFILFYQLVETPDMLLRNDEEVDWSMGVNILEYDNGLILIKNIGRFFSSSDLAEKTLGFHFGEAPLNS